MSNVEKLARSVDKEEKNWVEPIVNAHVLERISQVANRGIYSGYFKDVDGHLWEIVWNPQMLPE